LVLEQQNLILKQQNLNFYVAVSCLVSPRFEFCINSSKKEQGARSKESLNRLGRRAQLTTHIICRVAVSCVSCKVYHSTMDSDNSFRSQDSGISSNSSSTSSISSSATSTATIVTTSEDISRGESRNGNPYNIRADKTNTMQNFFSRSTSKNIEPPLNRSQKKVVRLRQQFDFD
jgi:hypothetical protein